MTAAERLAPIGLEQRVLAVDDSGANLVAFDAVLGDRYELIHATSAQQALAILGRDRRIDVILMDIQMPGMDGFAAARRIKAMPGCADIPLIFVSAVYNEDPEIRRGYEAGAVDYFTKPFDPDILRMKVDVYATFRRREMVIRERERQLRESEEVLRTGRKLTSALQGLPVGVLIADGQGRICQANAEVLRILGSARGGARAVEGNAFEEVLDRWERNAARADGNSSLQHALQAGESSHNQLVTLPCLDGSTKRIVESTSPLRGLDARVVGAVVVIQDVTAHEELAAELENRITSLVAPDRTDAWPAAAVDSADVRHLR